MPKPTAPLCVLALAGLSGVCGFAQAPSFEVATIKPSGPEEIAAGTSGFKTGHGRAVGTNVTLKRCIIGAYHIGPGQVIGGPAWIDSDRFHIEAKAATPTNDDSELDAMIRALLAERFHLALHKETKPMQALVLEVTKNGPKLEKAAGGDAVTDASHGGMILKNSAMDALAERLSRVTSLPVINQTGLDGIFNLKLTWTPDGERPKSADAPPDLPTAIQEQLGLRLVSRKAPVEVLVVEHAEKPDSQ